MSKFVPNFVLGGRDKTEIKISLEAGEQAFATFRTPEFAKFTIDVLDQAIAAHETLLNAAMVFEAKVRAAGFLVDEAYDMAAHRAKRKTKRK